MDGPSVAGTIHQIIEAQIMLIIITSQLRVTVDLHLDLGPFWIFQAVVIFGVLSHSLFLSFFCCCCFHSFVHIAHTHTQNIMSSSTTARLEAWQARLQNLTDLQVPTDYPRPLPSRTVEEVQSYDLSEQTLLSILQHSVGQTTPNNDRPTPFSILLAAFAVLLQRYTGDEEFAVGTSSPSNNTLVLRLNVNPQDTFSKVVNMVHQVRIGIKEVFLL